MTELNFIFLLPIIFPFLLAGLLGDEKKVRLLALTFSVVFFGGIVSLLYPVFYAYVSPSWTLPLLSEINLSLDFTVTRERYFFLVTISLSFVLSMLLVFFTGQIRAVFYVFSFFCVGITCLLLVSKSLIFQSTVQSLLGLTFFILARFGIESHEDSYREQTRINTINHFSLVLICSGLLSLIWSLISDSIGVTAASTGIFGWLFIVSFLLVVPGMPAGMWYFNWYSMGHPSFFIMMNMVLAALLGAKIPLLASIVQINGPTHGAVLAGLGVVNLLLFGTYLFRQYRRPALVSGLLAVLISFVVIRIGLDRSGQLEELLFFAWLLPVLAGLAGYLNDADLSDNLSYFFTIVVLYSLSSLPGSLTYGIFGRSVSRMYTGQNATWVFLAVIWFGFFLTFVFVVHRYFSVFFDFNREPPSRSESRAEQSVSLWMNFKYTPIVLLIGKLILLTGIAVYWGPVLFVGVKHAV